MFRCFFMAIVLVPMLSLQACSRGDTSSDEQPTNFPARVGDEGDSTAMQHEGSLGLTDGAPAASLTMDLSRPYQPGEAGTYACYSMPADDLSLGSAVCSANASLKAEIKASNVTFTCTGNATFAQATPKTSFNLPGCEAIEIYTYAFTPALHLVVGDAVIPNEL